MVEEHLHETHGHKTTSSEHGERGKVEDEHQTERQAERKGISSVRVHCSGGNIGSTSKSLLVMLMLIMIMIMTSVVHASEGHGHEAHGHGTTTSSEHEEREQRERKAEETGILCFM